MITGTFSANGEPHIRLFVRGSGSILHEVDAVVDTGFNGELSLPSGLISALGLPFHSRDSRILADGSVTLCDMYVITVLWDGADKQILVETADGDALVGTLLMDGYKLYVEMWAGGAVTLEKRP